MKNFKFLTYFFLLVLLLQFKEAIADESWVAIASSKAGMLWEGKAGSFEFTQNKSGVVIGVLIGRVTSNSSSSVTLEKWYVSLDDCVKGNGTLVTLKISGEYQYETDFVIGAGNVSSEIAETVCAVASGKAEEIKKKSL